MENEFCLKIFLVDNDPFSLYLYQQQLNNIGYGDVTQFNNSIDCLGSLAQKPNVIFIDYRMDIINDLDLLKTIKRFNPDIYVVFTTGPEDIETTANSLKYGAFDYVVKKDHELTGIGRILASIYEIGQLLKNAQPSFIKKFHS